MKVIIIGGVAGGATAAARIRRNDESAQIIMFERGEYISFANCGLPYYIGEVIKDKGKLTLQTPESFHARFNVDVRVLSEVIKIDPENKAVVVKNIKDNTEYTEHYDKLVLSPGASPTLPPIEGINNDRVFTLRNIPDTYRIKDYCDKHSPKNALVIGGGYIGIEMAENLHHLGIKVTVVELMDHIIGAIDSDMAAELQNHIRQKGVDLILKNGVTKVEQTEDGLAVGLLDGTRLETDIIILSVGVRPEVKLAQDAGLTIGKRGGIVTDEHLRTDNKDIYAVGDAIEVKDFISGQNAVIPLASPANKQGRIAADNICGKDEVYEATQGTAILKVFDMTAAMTGNSESMLKNNGIAYIKSYTYSQSNASYYPGAMPIAIKLLFAPVTGKLLGAQATGYTGVDKRMDVLATALRVGLTVSDLEKLELCYAPPYSSAKDPVNMAGYVANNIIKAQWKPFYVEDIRHIDRASSILLDVRTGLEYKNGTIEDAVNIPVDELRGRLNELPKDKAIYIFCQIGLRGYIAARLLMQNGFSDVKNLSGGYRMYNEINKNGNNANPKVDEQTAKIQGVVSKSGDLKIVEVDACGLSCPGPILEAYKALNAADEGDIIVLRATDPAFSNDIAAWCGKTGNKLIESGFKGKFFEARIQKGSQDDNSCKMPYIGGNDKSIIVFSGDLDKVIAGFIIANGAAAMGRKVHMFFTFWGLNVLRRRENVKTKKDILAKMFGMMMPKGSLKLSLSKLSMGGIGGKLIRYIMRSKNIDSLESLIQKAMENGVNIIACNMSMDVMGINKEELIDGVNYGGVATFLAHAEDSDTTLFI